MKAWSDLLWLLPVTAAAAASKHVIESASPDYKLHLPVWLAFFQKGQGTLLTWQKGWDEEKQRGIMLSWHQVWPFLQPSRESPCKHQEEFHTSPTDHTKIDSPYGCLSGWERQPGPWIQPMVTERATDGGLSNNYLHKPTKFHLKASQGSVPHSPIGRLFQSLIPLLVRNNVIA